MCGIVGVYNLVDGSQVRQETLVAMTEKVTHRGPDDSGYFVADQAGLGFRRLSIMDLDNGNQPFYSEDGRIVAVCNGEIFNFKELRRSLETKGHQFRTNCDVEVLVPLYQEFGLEFVDQLNGQFAIALLDQGSNRLVLARDQVGIVPLFYTVTKDVLIFASEIKAILEHPLVDRAVELRGLDQVFTYPGVVSPTTMFKNIHALKPGHFLTARGSDVSTHEYWDLDFPVEGVESSRSEDDFVDELDALLRASVRDRLAADVPVGYYLSGGLDSSLIASLVHDVSPGQEHHSFSIGFEDAKHDERSYQNLLAQALQSRRRELVFDWTSVESRLREAVYHSETPLKETYNTCSLALSELVNESGIKVILTGEGADELFAGYVGYRIDSLDVSRSAEEDLDESRERGERDRLWGDKDFFYEKKYYELRETKLAVYSGGVRARFDQFNSVQDGLVDKSKLRRRHKIHKRSYIDCKLRLSDHLLADHGDRVAYANSIEARYPFLDIRILDFVRTLPTNLKVKGAVEKYILKQVASRYVPKEIVDREKFHFVAPGSPALLAQNIEWIEDTLSSDSIRRQGYFDPETVESIKKMYRRPGFELNLPFDTDLLVIILTFCVFLEEFKLPSLR